jgi:hypothetical protein
MSKRGSIFAAFSLLMGLLLFAIWSNIHVYGQQQLSRQPPRPQGPDSPNTTKISAQLKAKLCDPSNPSLKVVNTTEARICSIPKTVKNTTTTTAATAPTSYVSSSTPEQTTTIKSTSVAGVSHHPPPKQQQITNTINNNANVTSRPTEVATGSKIAPVTITNSLSSSPSSSPSHIAPQVKAVNQPQQQQHQTPITRINGTAIVNNTTAGQNYTFTSTTPTLVSSDKSNPSNHGSSSIDKSGSSPNLKPSSDSTRSAITTNADSGSIDKKDKKQSSSATTKSDNTPTINSDDSNPISKSSHHIRSGNSDTQDSGSTTTKTSRFPSDLASSIKNKVDSIIRNSMRGLIDKTPFILPFH